MTADEIQLLLQRELPTVDHRSEVIQAVSETQLTMLLPCRPEYLSTDLPPGSGQSVFSAPIMMGFADTAMYAAIHAFYGPAAIGAIVTITTSFLRVAGTGDLIAQVDLLRKGRRLAFLETTLQSADSKLALARITATYTIWQPNSA